MRPRMGWARTVACGGLLLGCAASGPQRPAPTPSGTVVTAEDIDPNPSRPIEETLQGKCAQCVVVRTPSGQIAIGIRGRMTLTGRDRPLYVIDGIPIQAGPNGELADVNVYDIATITLLTDPASTSMYGARGATGVILITLKR